ncbi:matrix protein [Porcine ephemerovirus 2]|uniref:Matrix protein n=1 Tax=Porcine ephemerovirus 2 TaxID=2928257 RepID=A0AAX3A8C2_9RHAB|nr:matrix protein [Porcine ephemerovirus 2]UNP42119.1 matrix protein [Porcine ephemerovirus 2]
MMALWKKKRSNSSISTIDPGKSTNLWLRDNDSYDGAFGYIPEDDQEEEIKPISIQQGYMIHANLEVHTHTPVDNLHQMIKILDSMVDEYDGSFLGKPIITMVYLILGTHLMQQKTNNARSYMYKNGFVESLIFSHDVNLVLPSKGVSYDKYIHCYHKGEPATISYHVTVMKTKRNGKNFMDAYFLKLPNGLPPPNPKSILKSYGIELSDVNQNATLFLMPD